MTPEEKKKVLELVDVISAEELYAEIYKSNVLKIRIAEGEEISSTEGRETITLEGLMETGKLKADKRIIIEGMLAADRAKDEEEWDAARQKGTEEGYMAYLSNFKYGKHRQQANGEIARLMQQVADDLKRAAWQRSQDEKQKEQILAEIKRNPNGFNTPKTIMEDIAKRKFTPADLLEIGIPQDVIDSTGEYVALYNDPQKKPTYHTGAIPEKIKDGVTEVYFWGIPGSGKTSALSGILSYASESGVLDTKISEGFHYMNQLKNTFKGDIGFLPPRTRVEATQYLPFELRNNDKKKKYPIALMELSGEIFQCYYYHVAKLDFPGEGHQKTFDTVRKFLAGPNKKLHFFVFDLSVNPRERDEYGLCQDDYLNAAKSYFEENNIFSENTSAIYVITTKSDRLPCAPADRGGMAKQVLMKNYSAFINGLKEAVEKYRINENNTLHVLPFSLGSVYFNYICKFDPQSSADVVKILVQKTDPAQNKGGLLDFFNR